MKQHIKNLIRDIYLSLPFRKAILTCVRSFYSPSRSLEPHLTFKGPMRIRVGDATFIINNDHGLDIEARLFWHGIEGFEPQSVALWRKLCARSKVIVDVGANTGVYSLVAKALNPTARVIAFEPIRRIHSKLSENNQLNGYDIGCHAIALSDYDGTGTMYDLPHDHVYAVMLDSNAHVNKDAAIAVETPVRRLDSFLREKGISSVDLIKIDVESQEPKVIAGLSSMLVSSHPTMIVEIWNDEMGGGVGQKVEQALKGTDYHFYAIHEDSGPEKVDHIVAPASGYINYLICTHAVAQSLSLDS